MSFIVGLYDVFSWLGLDYGFLNRTYHGNGPPFSPHPIRRYVIPVGIIPDYIHLEPLVKKVSARFLHCEVTNFTISYFIWK